MKFVVKCSRSVMRCSKDCGEEQLAGQFEMGYYTCPVASHDKLAGLKG